jgi:hypothetical protein
MHHVRPITNRSLLNTCGIFRKRFNAELYSNKQFYQEKHTIIMKTDNNASYNNKQTIQPKVQTVRAKHWLKLQI